MNFSDLFRRNPETSLREALEELEVTARMPLSLRSLWRILRESLKWRFRRATAVQQLKEGDYEKRVEFAENILQGLIDTPDFLERSLWSDECLIPLHPRKHRRNTGRWSAENEGEIEELPMNGENLMVWAAVCPSFVIGPYYFDQNVNGANYLEMLADFLVTQLEQMQTEGNLPPACLGHFYSIVFMHDGAPPHRHGDVKDFLNRTFTTWIGNNSDHCKWPPRSPDLTPMDFGVWAYVKAKMKKFRPKPVNRLQLRASCDAAFEVLKRNGNLRRKLCKNEMILRCRLTVEVEGHHFQQFIQRRR
jgi:hypothetical protein